jgi:hypothetical protein
MRMIPHLPIHTGSDDAGAIGAAHACDVGQGGWIRAGICTSTAIACVGQEVNTGAAATVLAADASQALLACKDKGQQMHPGGKSRPPPPLQQKCKPAARGLSRAQHIEAHTLHNHSKTTHDFNMGDHQSITPINTVRQQ